MATNSVNRILGDLNLDFNDLAAAHGFSVMGLERLPAYVATLPKHSMDQDPLILVGDDLTDNPKTPHYAGWRLSEVISQVKRNGPVETRLGHL